jgi:4-amino-4-deoxy-L-arabinose transferase-like glycosyltransferase
MIAFNFKPANVPAFRMTESKTPELAVSDGRALHRRRVILWSLFVFLLVALAFVVRLWGLGKMHYWDEAVYLQNAEVICCGKANFSELESRPPLLSLFFAFIFLFWHHIYAACIGAALLNALSPALLFAAGRRIVAAVPAAIAALLLAFLPFFVGVILSGCGIDNTGNSLLSDSPALTLMLLSLWLLLRALEKQTSLRFASAGFVMALTVLMRFASLSTAGVLSLLVLTANRRWRSAAACGLGFAAGIAPYLCWSRLSYGGFLTTFRNGWTNFEGPEESPFFYLRNFTNVFGWITLAGLALWIGNWAWERWKLRGKEHRESLVQRAPEVKPRRLEGFLCLWAAAVLLCFSLLSHKEQRYVIPLAPPVLLLAGSGLSVLVKGRRKALRSAGAVLLAAALAYTFLPTIDNLFETPFINDEVTDQMEVSDYLSRSLPPSAVLYSVVDYPVFAYYTNLKVIPVIETSDELYDALDRLPNDGVFIAYKESDAAEGPRLSWLDANPHFRRLREYPTIVLYSYRATASLGKPGP